jgi:hypothetical protein
MRRQKRATGEYWLQLSLQYDPDDQRGFKSLKQLTKMNYLFLKRPDKALQTYRELLSYTKVGSVNSCADLEVDDMTESRHTQLRREVYQ